MKTIYTTLPIYDRLEKQAYERSKHYANTIYPIICPRHRLPSFQWKDETDAVTAVNKIELINTSGSATDITSWFATLPASHAITGDVYFQYKGTTLLYLMTPGVYYLKIDTNDAGGFHFINYSEWFQVTCVYTNLISSWTNATLDLFTTNGTAITSAVEVHATANTIESGESFYMRKGESVKIITAFTLGFDQLPTVKLANSNTVTLDNNGGVVPFLNEITLTATQSGLTKVYINNTASTNWSMSEVWVFKEYSSKYLILDFYNTCDLGDILYHDGFTQTLWFESETMESTYPYEEEGQKNSDGKFIKTFGRQVKKYTAKTKTLPDYMIDVFNRLKLHDHVELTDLFGDVNTVYNLDVEHEWLFDDKYYANADLTFDFDEAVVISACCENIE